MKTSVAAITNMMLLYVCVVVILIPSPKMAQTCDKEECSAKPAATEECGCAKMSRTQAEASKVPEPIEATVADSKEDSETGDVHSDAQQEEGGAETDRTGGHTAAEPVVGADDKHEKEKYLSAANVKSPYPRTNQMSCLPGGLFNMGTNEVFLPEDGEGPARPVHLNPFCIDVHEVSVGEFELFVNATGHQSYAEEMGDSFVVEYFVSEKIKANITQAVVDLPWWLPVKNATWKTPEGKDSNTTHRKSHAVVHVAYTDAEAYCKWAGKRLPTEAEWEFACKGGLHDRLFPWGNLQQPREEHRMNIWQGKFPHENTAEDGHASMGPVTEYLSQNKYGLKNIVGNVWEWVADYAGNNKEDARNYPEVNPTGPMSGFDRVKKGGSFMCSIGYCYRYRCAARSSNSPDTTAYNLGFRCAADKLPDYIPPYDVEAVLAEEEKLRQDGKVLKSPDDWVEKVERARKLAESGHA